MKREIKVLRQFNHPHIIKHYEFIDTASDIFMVIEFASGGELFDLISRRKRVSLTYVMLPTAPRGRGAPVFPADILEH